MNKRRRLLADCCSAFASTAPDPLPQTHGWQVAADRFLAATRPQLTTSLVALGILASVVSDVLEGRQAMIPLGLYFLVAGGWCVLNFLRSREAHCVVTGFGWVGLAAAVPILTPDLGDWRNAAWMAFLLTLAVGIGLEAFWASTHNTTALRG